MRLLKFIFDDKRKYYLVYQCPFQKPLWPQQFVNDLLQNFRALHFFSLMECHHDKHRILFY